MHHGADVSAPEGSPVYSPLPGVVQRIWPNQSLSRYGVLMMVYIPEANVTMVYAHLMELPRKADGTLWRQGDVVNVGDEIGKVGYTGGCGHGSRVSVHGVRCTPCGPGGLMLCGGRSSSHCHVEVRPGRINRPNPVANSINPALFAREYGFNLFTPASLGRLGQAAPVYSADSADCVDSKYYCDPEGFEPGDDEPAPWSTPAKVALSAGLAALVAVVVVKALS